MELGTKVVFNNGGVNNLGRIWALSGTDQTCIVRVESPGGHILSVSGWLSLSAVTPVKE